MDNITPDEADFFYVTDENDSCLYEFITDGKAVFDDGVLIDRERLKYYDMLSIYMDSLLSSFEIN